MASTLATEDATSAHYRLTRCDAVRYVRNPWELIAGTFASGFLT